MRFSQPHFIRFYILAIALIGSMAFVMYLSTNVMLARQTEAQVNSLIRRDYPVIEHLRGLMTDSHELRESLASAILLKNRFLIEDALEHAYHFKDRLSQIDNYNADDKLRISMAKDLYDRYLLDAQDLALALADSDSSYERFAGNATTTHAAFTSLQNHLNSWLQYKNDRYEATLLAISRNLNRTHQMALLAGIMLIVGLFLLAWTVASRVLRAIRSSDRLKEGFLATISHELRTPMNGIFGNISLLRKSALTDEQHELVESARHCSLEMIKTVDEILTFTDFMSGTPKVSLAEFSLQNCLALHARVMLEECDKRRLSFTADVSQAQGLLMLSDEHKVVHVLRRLLENALKFTSSGDISLGFRIEPEVEPEPVLSATRRVKAIFTVTDSGPGVKAAVIREVFKPFHQLDSSFTRQYGGLGIGLAISKAVSDSLQGSLHFYNRTDGQGAIVSFSFPCEVRREVQTIMKVTIDAPPVSLTVAPNSAARPCVMVVEDNRVNQLVMNKLLQKLQVTTVLAGNGQEALAALQEKVVNLILMDCQMPVMDGFEATRRIRELPGPVAAVPIIAVTANAMDGDRQRCLDAGMNAFVSKPVDLGSLRQQLSPYITLADGEPAGL